jgi:lysyl-tRNA synthetase class 1
MHWVDVAARDLLARGSSHTIASGTSISGVIHIGNAGDVIIADAIAKSIVKGGGTARVLWIMDDLDPLRSVPENLPQEFRESLGKPDHVLPCPVGCCGSFVEHYANEFMKSLAQVGVRPEVVSGARMYREGKYDEDVRAALQNAAVIRQILKDISGSEKAKDWLPFDPICEKCGKIATTEAYAFEGGKVLYECRGGVAGKKAIAGCGHKGTASIRDGKLTWRVDWAARWKTLGVTCEPFGKEHAAAGGSYDTCSAIVRKVYGREPPYPIRYEHIQVGGKKMSKSAGNVRTLQEIIDLATPEITRFFFFRTQPNVHKDLELGKSLLPVIEEYEQAERIFFDAEKAFSEKEEPDIKRAYEISQVEGPPPRLFQVRYRHLTMVMQLAKDWEDAKRMLSRTDDISTMTTEEEARLRRKANAALKWVREHAPSEMRVELHTEPPEVELSSGEREVLKAIHKDLAGVEWRADTLHDAVHGAAIAVGAKPKVAFAAMYKIFFTQERGPRLGHFLATQEREFVLGRVKHYVHKDTSERKVL